MASRRDDSTAQVRVKHKAQSTLRGKTLKVLQAKRHEKGSNRVSYLCEMPGWPQPGWFSEDEVERV